MPRRLSPTHLPAGFHSHYAASQAGSAALSNKALPTPTLMVTGTPAKLPRGPGSWPGAASTTQMLKLPPREGHKSSLSMAALQAAGATAQAPCAQWHVSTVQDCCQSLPHPALQAAALQGQAGKGMRAIRPHSTPPTHPPASACTHEATGPAGGAAHQLDVLLACQQPRLGSSACRARGGQRGRASAWRNVAALFLLCRQVCAGSARSLLPPPAKLTGRSKSGDEHEQGAGRDARSAPHGCPQACVLTRLQMCGDVCACKAWETGREGRRGVGAGSCCGGGGGQPPVAPRAAVLQSGSRCPVAQLVGSSSHMTYEGCAPVTRPACVPPNPH